MATRIDISRELVSEESLVFMRPITLKITATNLKPNTRMYAYFDGIDVNRYMTPQGGSLGDSLVTDVNGALIANFDVPGMTFSTGDKEFVLSDYATYVDEDIVGTSIVRAKAVFMAQGKLQTFQTTETSVTIVEVERIVEVVNYDPLAQSFFTYDVQGGVYITGLDLYFLTKDTTLPVWVEIREMANGYPSPKLVSQYASKTVNPSDVFISADASVPTKFVFDRMLYLEQDREYCFVVRSNSNKYNLWVSGLGEQSVENGKTIFEQPYMGSLFKSENNVTWSAEQTKDIKFTLYKAEFDVNTNAVLKLAVHPNILEMDSKSFKTFNTLNGLVISFPFKHGLDTSSKIGISADTNGNYNGFTGTQLTADHVITEVIDEYNVVINVTGGTANKTGAITTNQRITSAIVTNRGSNYSATNPPTVVVTGTGTGAVIEPIIKNGEIVDLVVKNQGTGYGETTTISFDSSGTSGSGATATAVFTNKLTVYINRVYQSVIPYLYAYTPANTDITTTLKTTNAAFENGAVLSYTAGENSIPITTNKPNYLNGNYLAASRINEKLNMGSNYSTEYSVTLSSTNKNVSPVFDLNNSRMIFRNNSINNQKIGINGHNEVLTSTNSSGEILDITITSGGSGYNQATVEIIIAGTGTGAVATATVTSGVITSITLTSGGSGYYGPVTVIASDSNQSAGGAAAALVAVVSNYNSELSTTAGRGLARYITKPLVVGQISNGIRCYATAYSNSSSNFDVYVKTALSINNINLDSIEWKALSCNIQRNRSTKKNEYFDYEFILDDIEPFDTYQLKFVLRSTTPWDPPKIRNFRAIVTS